jgi:hypothetical protein
MGRAGIHDMPRLVRRNKSASDFISTDAQRPVARANDIVNDDPAAALALYREVQTTNGGGVFRTRNSTTARWWRYQFERRHAEAAIRPFLDALWATNSKGDSLGVDRVLRKLRDRADLPEFARPVRALVAVASMSVRVPSWRDWVLLRLRHVDYRRL